MGVTTIQYIDNPPFVVDFREFVPPRPAEGAVACFERVQAIGLACIVFAPIVAGAIVKAGYDTAKNSGTAFKQIVFGFYGSWYNFRWNQNIYLVAFKVVFWVLAMGWCFVTTACRTVYDKIPTYSHPLEGLNSQMNIGHIKSNEMELDASWVDRAITVDKLEEIYDQINFDHPDAPGYMRDTSRAESATPYTKEELRASLMDYINKVRTREAFLGTPPIYDTPRLMSFYQQIEDAVRISIAMSDGQLRAFREKEGDNPARYTEAAKREYHNILEDRARIAINLGIAGKHCGARFMGESMELYYAFDGGKNLDGTLEEVLIETLARKRQQIAKTRILVDLGSDTHSYNKYMSNLGQVLGIPGTKNIIEHLDNNINRDEHLVNFFNDYTVNCIIETIQEEVKKKNGNAFRVKILDWLREQVREWNVEKYQKETQELVESAQKILSDQRIDISLPVQHIDDLLEIIALLRTKGIPLPDKQDWTEFLDEVFGIEEVKKFYVSKYPDLNVLRLMQRKLQLKECCSEANLGKELLQSLQDAVKNGTPLNRGPFIQRFSDLYRAGLVRSVVPSMERDTAVRVVRGELAVPEAVHNYQEFVRRGEFIEKFNEKYNLEDIAKNGIPDNLMEWLLVSHHILMPQVLEVGV